MNKVNFSNDLIILPFSKIFFRLAIPNLFSTLMSSATVIFDLWYIGLIGMSELAGVAYIFPIFMLTSMLSNGAFGGAISGATARAFGSKNIFQAECIFRSAVLIAISFDILALKKAVEIFPEDKIKSGFHSLFNNLVKECWYLKIIVC